MKTAITEDQLTYSNKEIEVGDLVRLELNYHRELTLAEVIDVNFSSEGLRSVTINIIQSEHGLYLVGRQMECVGNVYTLRVVQFSKETAMDESE